jgi:hypothetical protein
MSEWQDKEVKRTINVIGLFGTCGGSNWRDKFIEVYEGRNITYFNPQVADWKPENAVIEAEHLTADEIILFPVTDETYGSGSLTELGFAAMQAALSNRKVIVFVASEPNESLKVNPVAFNESVRARRLALAHLGKISNPNVLVVDSLDAMLEASLATYALNND